MNTKVKLIRLVIAAAFGSLLWAGCASSRPHYGTVSTEADPQDLTKRRPDTHPEWRTGLDTSIPTSSFEPSGTIGGK